MPQLILRGAFTSSKREYDLGHIGSWTEFVSEFCGQECELGAQLGLNAAGFPSTFVAIFVNGQRMDANALAALKFATTDQILLVKAIAGG